MPNYRLRIGTQSSSPATEEWQALPFSSYSYIPPRDPGNNPAYSVNSPTAISTTNTDASTAVTLTTVPFREFSRPSPTDDGRLYYHGGLHSGYPGNDIVDIGLASPLTATQIARPHVPVSGDSGYSTSATATLWKNYVTALDVGDRDQWQPYTYHNYCKNTWHPRLGYLLTNYYPVSWDGSGFPVSSQTTYGDYDGLAYGTIRYNDATNRYTLQSASPTAWILQDLSDYCPNFDGILGLSQHNGNFNWLEMSADTSDAWVFARSITADGTTGAGNQFNGGNGTVIKHIEGWKFLVLHSNYASSEQQRMWTYDHNTGAIAAVSVPATATAGGNFLLAVDKAGRRVFCGVLGSPLTVYVCDFSSLGTWALVSLSSAPNMTQATAQAGRELMFYWRGALYLFNFYGGFYYRAGIDGTHPTASFEKRAVSVNSAEGYNIVSTKHTNLAYCPDDDYVYLVGGDMTESYSQEAFKYGPLASSPSWSQIQGESGADPGGNASGVRPMNPDDGGFYWDGTESAFWWFAGGGQFGQSSSTEYLRKSSDMPTLEQWATLYSTHGSNVSTGGKRDLATAFNALTRWKTYEHMLFDPVAGDWTVVSFTATDTTGWTDSQLAYFYGGEQGRGNAHDTSARKFFRITQGGGFNLFMADLATRTWRPFTCARLADGTAWNDSDMQQMGYGHQCFAVDPSNGRLYGVRTSTGELFYIDTRGTPIPHEGGPVYRLPIYVLSNALPALGTFGMDHAYMRLYKGGLLFWYTNPNSLDGDVRGSWWRNLTGVDSSEWVPVQFPFDFVANSVTTNTIDTDSYLAMGASVLGGETIQTVPNALWVIS